MKGFSQIVVAEKKKKNTIMDRSDFIRVLFFVLGF
jgi:hypothetical protein